MTRTEKYKEVRAQIYREKLDIEKLKRQNKALKDYGIALTDLIEQIIDHRTDTYNSMVIKSDLFKIMEKFGRAYAGKSK